MVVLHCRVSEVFHGIDEVPAGDVTMAGKETEVVRVKDTAKKMRLHSIVGLQAHFRIAYTNLAEHLLLVSYKT